MAEIATLTWRAADFETAARDLLRGFASVAWRVVGTCMEPAIPEGATVVLENVERARPRFGDVVLARFADGIRLHRLVWAPRRASRAWRTQADRAWLFDAGLSPGDVLATVVSVDGQVGSPRRVRRAAASLLRTTLRWLRLRLLGPGAE